MGYAASSRYHLLCAAENWELSPWSQYKARPAGYLAFFKTSGTPANLFKLSKVLMATPQERHLGYHRPEQVSNPSQEPPDSRPCVLTNTPLGESCAWGVMSHQRSGNCPVGWLCTIPQSCRILPSEFCSTLWNVDRY